MYVALYHNPKAGLQTFAVEDVARLIRDAHHEVDVFKKGDDDVHAAIAAHPDAVIAAGGDGTIAAAAKELWKQRSSIPLYVLPLGTSNNIAWSLGLSDVVPVLVRGLASARETTLDIGLIEACDHHALFVEAAGAGFFGAALHNERSFRERARRAVWHLTGRRTKGDAQVRAAARGIARRIRHAPTLSCQVLADGTDLSGEYVAIEAMNIRSIGPRMRLAPDASSADGMLDLVLVRAEERQALATLIESQEAVRAPVIDCRRVHDVELSWPKHGHVDDEPWPGANAFATNRRVHLCVGGSVRLLLPQC